MTSWIQYFYTPGIGRVGTFEAVFVGEVENDENSICLFEIVFGEGEELFLPGGIPNAHRNLMIIHLDNFLVEVQSECRGVEMAKGFYNMLGEYLPPR